MFEQSLLTAVVTPFTENAERLDLDSLGRLLKLQDDHNNGIIVMGSTGENLSLTDDERLQLLEFICALNLSSPIICGVSSYNTKVSTEWIEYCNHFPISGYLIATPIYTKPGVCGQTKWFEKLLNKAAYPCMLYNIPGRAGVSLHTATVNNLAAHEKFVAIKDSSGDPNTILDYKSVAPNISVYCGDDNMIQQAAETGACGLVSVASNIWPDIAKWYVQCCLQKMEMDHSVWLQASNALFDSTNPIPVKSLLKLLKLITHDDVRMPLSNSDLVTTDNLMNAHKMLMDWYNAYVS